jgi:hypothetical protein
MYLAMICSAFCGYAVPAHATVISFENTPELTVISNQYDNLGVTFAGGGQVLTAPNYSYVEYPPHSGISVLGALTSDAITVTFAKAVGNVIAYGSTGYYNFSNHMPVYQDVVATAYDDMGGIVDTAVITSPDYSDALLDLHGANIWSVVFSGRFGYFTLDDLTFDTIVTSNVPESSSWAMMMVGFGVVGAAMRRRANIKIAQV